VIEYKNEHFIVANALLEDVSKQLPNLKVLESFKGSLLSQYTCDHPLYNRESILVHGDHVTTLAGTGLVHTAPGHVLTTKFFFLYIFKGYGRFLNWKEI